jgi:mRNA-degrading endonuclease RelE of RelBE toxin-antitoxin system
MKLVIDAVALKRLRDMPPNPRRILIQRLEAIAAAPQERHPNVVKLVGGVNEYRVRQEDWRAVFELKWEDDEMYVSKIEPRGGVYQ